MNSKKNSNTPNIKKIFEKIEKNEIKSKDLNIFDFFEHNNIFIVKEFQRKYEWLDIQIEELIFELDNYRKKTEYFLGMIILKNEKKPNSSHEFQYNIVDGQQRITTLFLILKSIEKNIKTKLPHNDSIKIESLLKKIKNTYSLVSNNLPKLKISSLRGEKELENILIGNNFEKNKSIKSYQYYYKAFYKIDSFISKKNYEEILEFYEKIRFIKFSIVVMGIKINEYKIFEDLNSKGVDLKIDDLIRNFLSQKAADLKPDDKEIQHYLDKYEKMLHQIENLVKNEERKYFNNQISRWFKSYIWFKKDSKVTLSEFNQKRMYNIYKKEVDNRISKIADLNEEITLMKSYLKFCELMDQTKNNEIFLVNQVKIYPIFFSLYEKYIKYEKENFDKLFKVFALIYIRIICSKKNNFNDFSKKNLEIFKNIISDDPENDFDKIISLIFEHKNLNINKESLKKKLTYKIHQDNIVESDFKNFVYYFFSKMIEYKNNKVIKLHDEIFNLEHIIPLNPNYDSINDSKEKEEIESFCSNNSQKMKNMMLIEKKLNEELKNHFFKEKKEIYNSLKDHNIFLKSTDDVFSLENFEEKELNERFDEIKYFIDQFIEDIFEWNT